MTTIFYSGKTNGFYPDDIFSKEQMPDDVIEISFEEHESLLDGQTKGKEIKPDESGRPYLADQPPLTEAQETRLYEMAVQSHMDTAAHEHGYDNIATAVSYADEPAVTKFQREGKAFREWRSMVWAFCYDMLAKYKAGTIEKPTVEQLVSALPALVIPSA